MSGHSYEVEPLSRRQIRSITRKIREIACEVTERTNDEPYFDIVMFLDVILPKHWEDFVLEILTVQDMRRHYGEAHAFTQPDEEKIIVRLDAWQGAVDKQGRDRSTLAHELGHLLLHGKVGFARKMANSTTPPCRDSEWQAKAFAGELLVSTTHITTCASPADVARIFGVSQDAAHYQWMQCKKAGLI